MTSPRTSPLRYRAFAAAVAILGICTIPGFAQSPDVVVQWNAAVLQGVGDSKLGPPMVARALFIVHNCIYDAWAAYSRTAVGTVFGRSLRRPKSEGTHANKNQGIRFAGDRAAVGLFAGEKRIAFGPTIAGLGYDSTGS